MSITVVGSLAFDAVKTPTGVRERMLGGAGTHFALAASLLDQVHVVGPVGDDFGPAELEILGTRGTDLTDVEHVPGGKTFFWSGVYHDDMNTRDTLVTELGVFETFEPKLSEKSRSAETLFLANIQPSLQLQVLDQMPDVKFSALDSMDLWINIARDDLVKVIERVDAVVLNDGEIRQLTGEASLVAAARKVREMGPSIVVAKQGEYGALVLTDDVYFSLPAFPLETVVDPTGAGDTFAGGFVGALSRGLDVRTAMAYGTAIASFNVEEFGTERVARLTRDEVVARAEQLRDLTSFELASI